ncbi:MAG TPA: general stress protein [Limnochordales bacterium]
MATTIGVFESRDQAERAVRKLRQTGFSEKEVSLVARGGDKGGRGRGDMEAGDEGFAGGQDIGEGVSWGGGIGALGGLLASAGALAIPGIGPIIAAGPLAAALSGAVAGGLAGGLLDMGIPEERGKQYEEDVKQGRVLCVVEADGERGREAAQIMREAGAKNVETHEGKR